MDIKRRKLWMAPLMLAFGAADAEAENTQSLRAGPHCGETVIRYGPPCGIRIGPPCKPRIGQECKPRIGPVCKPLPAEPLPPKQ